MECPKCGAQLKANAKFCPNCGEKQTEAIRSVSSVDEHLEAKHISQADSHANVQVDTKNLNKLAKTKFPLDWRSITGLVVGTLLILVGFYTIFAETDTSTLIGISNSSFGADFYTYTYGGIYAIWQLLGAIQTTLDSIHTALGWIIVAIGAAIDVIALKRNR